MASDEHYIVVTVECQRCKTKQKVHVAARIGVVKQIVGQTVKCLRCQKGFEVMVPDKIIRGPFPM